MAKKLYVGNLSFKCTDDNLRELFEPFGQVDSARVITDRETGRSKGFGFVEMSVDSEADAAVKELNKSEYLGRPLTVNEARPRVEGEKRSSGYGDSRGSRDKNRSYGG